MTTTTTTTPASTAVSPQYDLVLQRVVPVSPELIWAAWTRPEHITQWFTPAPWTTPSAEVDLRPGGIFRTVMRSPEGDENDNSGCYLEIVENERLVWTGALGPGTGRTTSPKVVSRSPPCSPSSRSTAAPSTPPG